MIIIRCTLYFITIIQQKFSCLQMTMRGRKKERCFAFKVSTIDVLHGEDGEEDIEDVAVTLDGGLVQRHVALCILHLVVNVWHLRQYLKCAKSEC